MKAYSGVEPYAFVSYSHADTNKVIEILEKLSLAGTRIWYDEGITPSSDYIDVIAKKIEDCEFFIAFISANSLASQYCADEIRFAYEEQKPLMVVRLDDSEMPRGLKMILNRYQSHSMSESEKAETTSKKILPSIPDKVKEQKGILFYTDLRFMYHLQNMETPYSNMPGYRVIATSRTEGNQYTILEKRLPYGSEYSFLYATMSKRISGFEAVLDVTWDFSFVRNMPKDDYFLTRFLYEIVSKDENTPPVITEKIIYRESYTTGEKIFYNYVEGQGTVIGRDGSKSVRAVDQSDPLMLRY